MTGLVTAIYDLGCAVGAIAAFVISEPMGRKRSIFAGNLQVIRHLRFRYIVAKYENMHTVFLLSVQSFKPHHLAMCKVSY